MNTCMYVCFCVFIEFSILNSTSNNDDDVIPRKFILLFNENI